MNEKDKENDGTQDRMPLEERRRAMRKTQGFKKIWNYFVEVRTANYYQKKIKSWRAWYQIPRAGFEISNDIKLKPGEVWYRHNKELDKIEYGIAKIGDKLYTLPPNNWILYNTPYEIKLKQEIKRLCTKYRLHYMDWGEVIEIDLFYNRLVKPLHLHSYNLCLISDLIEEKREPFGKDFQESDDMAYPVAIRISPYATQNDITDYVKKMFPVIKEYQKKYREKDIRIGKIKSKNPEITERNQFIYEHRDLPLKRIRKLLVQEFDKYLDDGHIAKIISLEKKRRKEL